MDEKSEEIMVISETMREQIGQIVAEKYAEALSITFSKEAGIMMEKISAEFLTSAVKLEELKRKELLTEREVGRLYSISPASLRTERCRGGGPRYVKDGRRVLYPRKELNAYFDRNMIKS